MKAIYPLVAVVILFLVGFAGVALANLTFLLGIVLPYLAVAAFVVGFVYRVVRWAQSPVPFHISTPCGQQKSLPWIKASNLESPYNTAGVIGRLALEVLFFRSLLRNTATRVSGGRPVYLEEKLLWAAGLVFHWSLLVVLLRHTRLFVEPVPFFVTPLQSVDGFFQIGVPALYVSSVALLLGLTVLFLRRVALPQVAYISLPSDYLPLFLIIGIAASGILMRHFYKVDLAAVKELALGLATLRPTVPAGIGPLFYGHLFLVTALFAYFPLSKLMHMGGIFLSPTRNLANDSRMRRHVNPWSHPVKVHTYGEWQEEFRAPMVAAGYELDEEAEEAEETKKQPARV